jgi:hypothetical protein
MPKRTALRENVTSLLLLALLGTVGVSVAAPAQLVCHLQDPEVNESSGLAASSRSDDYFFTHNDSGDSARIFAINRKGETLATFRVPAAKNLDWEDMARGRDPQGHDVLLLGDIGDNHGQREQVQVYQVPEPDVDPNRRGVRAETAPATRFVLQYPDGPHDSETLLFNMANGTLYLVTKERLLRASGVYATTGPLLPDQVNHLTKVGWVRFLELPATVRTITDSLGRMMATSGDISPTGDRVVLRTYTDAYEWQIPRFDVGAAFRNKPTHLSLPAMSQGESAAYTRDGKAILFGSEKAKSPIYEVSRP